MLQIVAQLELDLMLCLVKDVIVFSTCCGDPFHEDDIVMLNSSKEEQDKLQKAMEERRAKAKTAKKSKKSKALETIFKSPESTAPEMKSTPANGESSSNSSGTDFTMIVF
ncbi:replication termination factor 2 [Tachysurus ichikawai]